MKFVFLIYHDEKTLDAKERFVVYLKEEFGKVALTSVMPECPSGALCASHARIDERDLAGSGSVHRMPTSEKERPESPQIDPRGAGRSSM